MAKISNFGMHTAYLLGFEKIADVRGISSVVSLFENRMILSGIYLQIRPDRHVYIGKTSNIIRRFDRHLQNGVVMEELAFMPMHLRFLDKKEKDIIAKAERYGIALDNLLLVETPWRPLQKFQDLISDTEVESWLSENHEAEPHRNHLKEIFDQMSPGLRQQFNLAKALPVFNQVLPMAKHFVQTFILKPDITAGALWSADAYCIDQTQRFLPLIRLHAGTQTLMAVGFYRTIPHEPWMQVLCSTEALTQCDISVEEISQEFPYLLIEEEEEFVRFNAHARMMTPVLNELKKPIRITVINALRKNLLQSGNPALHYLLI